MYPTKKGNSTLWKKPDQRKEAANLVQMAASKPWRTRSEKWRTPKMNKDLTVGNPQTVLWKFCMPLFGSIIFQQLYNIADSLVAGKFVGENALAAVGNSY